MKIMRYSYQLDKEVYLHVRGDAREDARAALALSPSLLLSLSLALFPLFASLPPFV